jgi:hypothetical protein
VLVVDLVALVVVVVLEAIEHQLGHLVVVALQNLALLLPMETVIQ